MVLLDINKHHQQKQESSQQDQPDRKQKEQQEDIPVAAGNQFFIFNGIQVIGNFFL